MDATIPVRLLNADAAFSFTGIYGRSIDYCNRVVLQILFVIYALMMIKALRLHEFLPIAHVCNYSVGTLYSS